MNKDTSIWDLPGAGTHTAGGNEDPDDKESEPTLAEEDDSECAPIEEGVNTEDPIDDDGNCAVANADDANAVKEADAADAAAAAADTTDAMGTEEPIVEGASVVEVGTNPLPEKLLGNSPSPRERNSEDTR
jgi:hypothetical protein